MERLIPEAQIHERLGLRKVAPIAVPGRGPRVNLRRLNVNNAVYLNRRDVVALLRTESRVLGGDTVLDRLADSIMDVTS